jgi:hypothetical protein
MNRAMGYQRTSGTRENTRIQTEQLVPGRGREPPTGALLTEFELFEPL